MWGHILHGPRSEIRTHWPMLGLVIVAGLAIIGAPVAGLAYVRKEKGPARSWLAAAVLSIVSGGVVGSQAQGSGGVDDLAARGGGRLRPGT